MPARNNVGMEVSVTTPYMIKGIDGGINIPSVPPAASIPNTNVLSYPRFVISGIATVPIVAAVATDDPDIAENIVQLRIVATLSPPGQ
tara:strand:- start:381 stop:644 length:264 start_codon:yes stop_codon:yes gene_type:complete